MTPTEYNHHLRFLASLSIAAALLDFFGRGASTHFFVLPSYLSCLQVKSRNFANAPALWPQFLHTHPSAGTSIAALGPAGVLLSAVCAGDDVGTGTYADASATGDASAEDWLARGCFHGPKSTLAALWDDAACADSRGVALEGAALGTADAL